jgi:penicillin-binding protein 2
VNWDIITDGMAEVTERGAFHTAGTEHIEGIDFAGKTGTAEVVGHDISSHMAKSKLLLPNVWFVGLTPRRNPELVVAVLWQNGEFSYTRPASALRSSPPTWRSNAV